MSSSSIPSALALTLLLSVCVHAAVLDSTSLPPYTHQRHPTTPANETRLNRNIFLNTFYGFSTSQKTNTTILLIDGAAENQITYILRLRKYEAITAIIHIPTDPTILTSTSESRSQISHPSRNAFNLTLFHQFDAHVGVVTFNLLVFTNFTKYHAAGTYTVAGIVAYASQNISTLAIASGINSPGISFKSPLSLANLTAQSTVRLKLSYQPVGPDITSNPPSLLQLFSTARIHTTNLMRAANSTLINYAHSCNITSTTSNATSLLPESAVHCGIAYNSSDQTLALTLLPERNGAAVVNIAFPDLQVHGDVFETDITLSVNISKRATPIALVQPNTTLTLDYFGSELLYVYMYNVIQPDQRFNATDYVIDLDNGRYARIDFELSTFEQPLQRIAFVVVPPGQEYPAIQKQILNALKDLKGSAQDVVEQSPTPLFTAEPEMLPGVRSGDFSRDTNLSSLSYDEHLDPTLPISADFYALENSQAVLDGPYVTEDLRMPHIRSLYDQEARRDPTKGFYVSHVHVLIPPSSSLETAKSILDTPLLTIFAPNRTAIIGSITITENYRNVLVSFWLANYSISTFSEHKSRQIASSLSKAIATMTEVQVKSGNLTHLKANVTGVEATFDVRVSTDAKKIVANLFKNKTHHEQEIAADVYLHVSRLKITRTMLHDPSSASESDLLGDSHGNSSLSGLTTAIVAAIAILAFVALLPVFVMCIGFLTVEHNHPDEGSSETGRNNAGSPPDADVSTASSAPGPGAIVRDKFGRGNEEDYESFKLNQEMRQRGYFDAREVTSASTE
ncbi:hypothetical protein BWQ96_10135 [Gracilariopsis chorda]|uniref:Uncharacterized protein n=1 Tax=Gracilariopsis chorda TaxID=448386 RepID=A0A2V3IDM5_9FLOR|nr:hypothetical protein BWQ96_10135 [Gracilariopsis chorda]|eukprot:PXF40167.1 hypothetical protein BWQ96_10135 [Gracilariopsis chorda]